MHMHDPANPLRVCFREHLNETQLAVCNSIQTSRRFHKEGASTAAVLFPMMRYYEWLGINWEPDPDQRRPWDFSIIAQGFIERECYNDDDDELHDI